MKAKIYFEVVGKEKNLIKDFEDKILNKVEEYKEMKILNKYIADPIEAEKEFPDPKNPKNKIKVKLLTSYIELSSEFEDFEKLINFIINYSPSRIEIEDLDEIEIKYKGDKTEKITGMKFSEILSLISNKIIELSINMSQLYLSYMELVKKLNETSKNQTNQKQDSQQNSSSKSQ